MKTLSIYWPLRVQELEQMACITVPKSWCTLVQPTEVGIFGYFCVHSKLALLQGQKTAWCAHECLRLWWILTNGANRGGYDQPIGGQNSWQGKTIEDIKTSGWNWADYIIFWPIVRLSAQNSFFAWWPLFKRGTQKGGCRMPGLHRLS